MTLSAARLLPDDQISDLVDRIELVERTDQKLAVPAPERAARQIDVGDADGLLHPIEVTMKDDLQTIWDSRFANLLIDSMAEGVFTLDSKGRISSWNRAMERITGHKVEDAMGKPCKLLAFNRCFHRD